MIEIQKNIPLKKHSTFQIGGPAKYFTIVKNTSQLVESLEWAKQNNLPFFLLGGGSNILFSDKGYEGLIIKIQISDIKVKGDKVFCEAGTPLSKILNITAREGLSGLEWTAGIPGTIGGAIFGNAGAFGLGIKNILESVKVLNLKSFQIEDFKSEDCQFSYRSSIFKKRKNYVILKVELKLQRRAKEDIHKRIEENFLYRRERHPLKYPSVGSIFKNVKLTKENLKLTEKFPDFKQFLQKGEIPAAYLIHCCDLKGKKIGGAQISKKHPNFIININNAKAEDVIILISVIKQKVRNQFGIQLEEEIIIM